MSRFADYVRRRYGDSPLELLDVGGRDVHGGYRHLFQFGNISYTGLGTRPGENVDVVINDPYHWRELEDESFDVVICGQALEHIAFPWLTMEQIAAKLKRRGVAFIVAPSRGPEHRHPVDCYRFYPDGMRALAQWCGLEVLDVACLGDNVQWKDSSGQWGDCHCLLTKAEYHARKPPPQLNRAGSTAAQGLPRHTSNPLGLPKNELYFDSERPEVLDIIVREGLATETVLEIGCGSGATGRALKRRTEVSHYVGIESEERAAELARDRLDVVHCENIEHMNPGELGIEHESFDLLLALDVLEHLYDPWDALACLVPCLKHGGHAVLSIPNVRHHTILSALARGQWQYQGWGILDATHLRFFTLQGIRELMQGAGLSIRHADAIVSQGLRWDAARDDGNIARIGNLTISDLSRKDLYALSCSQYIMIGRRE